jgi:hypothetical protein
MEKGPRTNLETRNSGQESSEVFQDVSDQRVREVPGQPVKCRSFLLEKLGVVRVDLIFLVENVLGIGEENLVSMLIHQANVRRHHHLQSRGSAGILIESDHTGGDILHRALYDSVRVVRFCHHLEVCSFDKFANDGSRELLFDAKSHRLIGEGGDGNDLDIRRQAVAAARHVIPAGCGARRREQESVFPG